MIAVLINRAKNEYAAVVSDPARLRFARRSIFWSLFVFVLANVAAGVWTKTYQIGTDWTEHTCLPWRVYLVKFQPRSEVVVEKGAFVAVVDRSGQLGPKFKGRLLGKMVLATPGDTVEIKGDVLYINGKRHGPLTLNAKLGKGPGAFDRVETVPEGKFFIGGTSDRAYDSRYVGAFDQSDLVGTIRPLI